MDKGVVYIVTVVLTLLLQLGLAPAIAIGGCQPCFLLIPVLVIAMRSGVAAGSLAGFALGLVVDFAGSGAIGCAALAFVIVATLAGAVCAALESSSVLVSVGVGVVGALLFEFAYGIASVLTSVSASGAGTAMMGYALPSALYTMVFACVALVTMNLVIVDGAAQMPGLGALGGGGDRAMRIPSRYK